MRKIAICLMKSTFVIAIVGLHFDAASETQLPPASIFDMAEMLDVSTLDLKVISDKVIVIEGRLGKIVREVTFEFFSHTWQGEALRHKATVYVPAEGIVPEKKGMAVVNQSASSNPEPDFETKLEYGAHTALDLGIVSLLLEFSIQHSGIQGPGSLRRYTTAKFFETGDPNWIHWVALAKAYMRGMTAVNEIDGIEANRFVIGGSSKRAQAAWIVAATDKRVVGLVSIARPGNFTHIVQNHVRGQLETPPNLPIPGGRGEQRERMAYVEDLYTKRGYEYMAYIDPYYFMSRVSVPVMCMVGTNDNLFNNFDDHGFYPFYQGDKRFVYVSNYPHGMASQKHVQSYRAWSAYSLWGRPVTNLTALANIENGGLQVKAIVYSGSSSQSSIQGVNLYYCVLKERRFKDAADNFQSVPMQRVGDTALWQMVSALDVPIGAQIYWYVEAKDRGQGMDGFACTLLKRTVVKGP